jgi:hypothetical protein
MKTAPDYQSTIGFELVELMPECAPEHFYPVCVVREDGADDREASITERVLWDSLVEALTALNDAESILRYAPDISTNCLGKKPATTTAAALSKARAALKSNGWPA